MTSSDPDQYGIKSTFAESTELSFCCCCDFLIPERAIQDDLVSNKEDLVTDNIFHLNEPFQSINSRDKT